MNLLTFVASAEPASSNLFVALGIDWKMLIFQALGFVVLVWLLGKFVYPVLMKTVDARQAEIEASTKAAVQAEKKAAKAEEDIAKLMKKARAEASEIVTTAKEEANAAIEAAESKAKQRGERLLADAQDQIGKDVIAAKKALHNETLDLVALATEKVVGKTVSPKVDAAVISAAVKEAK